MNKVQHAQWKAEGTRLFGDDPAKWRFVCPACARVTQVQEWLDADASGLVAHVCIDRVKSDARGNREPGECSYSGSSTLALFVPCPVRVTFPDGDVRDSFSFAEAANV